MMCDLGERLLVSIGGGREDDDDDDEDGDGDNDDDDERDASDVRDVLGVTDGCVPYDDRVSNMPSTVNKASEATMFSGDISPWAR